MRHPNHSIFILLSLVCLLLIPGLLPAEQSREALAVLDQYNATMDQQSRIWFKFKSVGQAQAAYTAPGYKRLSGSRQVYEKGEVRFDGNRATTRFSQWGEVLVAGRFIPERNAIYHSRLWDGEQRFNYDTTIKPATNANEVQIISKSSLGPTDLYDVYSGPYLFCQFDYPGRRIDRTLREAKELRLKPGKENINGVGCLVLEARSPEGQYTAWFAPEHGYQIVRAHVIRSPGDVYPNTTNVLKKGQRFAYLLSDVRLISTNGAWVPVQANISTRRDMLGGQYSQSQQKITRSDIVLNPDFDVQKAFVPDDIVDGTEVGYIDRKRVNYKWKAGQVQRD